MAKGGTAIAFGDYGLMTQEPAWITSRQIEAARRAMTRYVKRGGKIWIRIFPDKPVTKKPAEVRMGSGKGAPDHWVAVVKPGRILFEMSGVPEARGRRGDAPGQPQAARRRQVHHSRRASAMDIDKVRALTDVELVDELATARRHLYDLRFQLATRQLTDYSQIAQTRRADRALPDRADRARTSISGRARVAAAVAGAAR